MRVAKVLAVVLATAVAEAAVARRLQDEGNPATLDPISPTSLGTAEATQEEVEGLEGSAAPTTEGYTGAPTTEGVTAAPTTEEETGAPTTEGYTGAPVSVEEATEAPTASTEEPTLPVCPKMCSKRGNKSKKVCKNCVMEAASTEAPTVEDGTDVPTEEGTNVAIVEGTEIPTTTDAGTETPTTADAGTDAPTTADEATEAPSSIEATEAPTATTEEPTLPICPEMCSKRGNKSKKVCKNCVMEAASTEAPTVQDSTDVPTEEGTEMPTTADAGTDAPTTAEEATEAPSSIEATEAPTATTEEPTLPICPEMCSKRGNKSKKVCKNCVMEVASTEAPTVEDSTDVPTEEGTDVAIVEGTETPTTVDAGTDAPTTAEEATDAPTTADEATEAPASVEATEAPTTADEATETPASVEATEAPTATTEEPTLPICPEMCSKRGNKSKKVCKNCVMEATSTDAPTVQDSTDVPTEEGTDVAIVEGTEIPTTTADAGTDAPTTADEATEAPSTATTEEPTLPICPEMCSKRGNKSKKVCKNCVMEAASTEAPTVQDSTDVPTEEGTDAAIVEGTETPTTADAGTDAPTTAEEATEAPSSIEATEAPTATTEEPTLPLCPEMCSRTKNQKKKVCKGCVMEAPTTESPTVLQVTSAPTTSGSPFDEETFAPTISDDYEDQYGDFNGTDTL